MTFNKGLTQIKEILPHFDLSYIQELEIRQNFNPEETSNKTNKRKVLPKYAMG
jgi:hypothetical protein